MVWSCFPFIRSGQNQRAVENWEKGKKLVAKSSVVPRNQGTDDDGDDDDDVTKLVHLQFLPVGTVPLGRRLEGKDDFAAYQPMVSVVVCTGHHSGVWFVSHVMVQI